MEEGRDQKSAKKVSRIIWMAPYDSEHEYTTKIRMHLIFDQVWSWNWENLPILIRARYW